MYNMVAAEIRCSSDKKRQLGLSVFWSNFTYGRYTKLPLTGDDAKNSITFFFQIILQSQCAEVGITG